MLLNKKTKSGLQLLGLFFLVLFFFVLNTNSASAASLYLSPGSGSYKVNQTFSVSVLVSSPDQAINAVSGTFSFPIDKLEITGVSTSGTKVSLWVQEPSFSKTAGTVNFEGIILNPGYTGSGARIININLRAKSAGTANTKFLGGSILANNGEGTNVLSGGRGGTYTITSPDEPKTPETPKETKPSEVVEKPAAILSAPVINSDNFPDPTKWYSNNSSKFSWTLPAETKSVYLLIDNKATSEPFVAYSPAISEKSVENMEDGIWYLHAYFANSNRRSLTTHFPFRIDSVAPTIEKLEIVPSPKEEPNRRDVLIEAKDSLSGIEYYEMKLNGQEPEIWQDDGSHIYRKRDLSFGDYTLTVKAFDKAGNYAEKSIIFHIKAVPDVSAACLETTGDPLSDNFKLIMALMALIMLVMIIIILVLVLTIMKLNRRLNQHLKNSLIKNIRRSGGQEDHWFDKKISLATLKRKK